MSDAPTADQDDGSWTAVAPSSAEQDFPVETAVQLARLAGIAGLATFRTRLRLPERGRFDLLVRYRPSHLAIDIRCDTASSYAWLASQRHLLEARLARVFQRPTDIETSLDRPA